MKLAAFNRVSDGRMIWVNPRYVTSVTKDETSLPELPATMLTFADGTALLVVQNLMETVNTLRNDGH